MAKENRICQNCKQQFTIEPDDFGFYEKLKVPAPTWCPECRMQRRMVFRNERVLYRDTCDLCKKSTFSMYSPDKPFTVYCRECWLSDAWNPLDFGVEYDWKKPFFVQYRSLFERVPRMALAHYHTNVNVDYANYVADSKNVYLAFSVIANSEDIYYSWAIDRSKNCFDCFNLNNAAWCYHMVDGARNYQSRYCIRSKECVDSSFLFDCVNCQNCFMSSNLRNKRFVVRNRQCSKEEYERECMKADVGSYSNFERLRKEFRDLMSRSLHKYGNIMKATRCTGDNIENSKNVRHSFGANNCEDAKFCFRIVGAKSVYDITGSGESELLYECVAGGFGSYHTKFSTFTDVTRDSYLSDWCHASSHMFGCVAARKREYCILNKQYTKEEYEALVTKIITHMNGMPYKDYKGRMYRFGEFFPTEISPFAYNETIAQEYFPLTEEEAISRGYSWRGSDARNYSVTRQANEIPDNIKDVRDGILDEILGCAHGGSCNEQCTTAFKVIPPELQFYQKMNLPLPRLCPNCRHYGRLQERNPLHLWHRSCQCAGVKDDRGMYTNTASHRHGHSHCEEEFETSYAPDRLETVYCESCYQSEVV